MNEQEATEAVALVANFWPSPPDWTDERRSAYVEAFCLTDLDALAIAKAIRSMMLDEPRRWAPAPAELVGLAVAIEREEASVERVRRRELPGEHDDDPSVLPTRLSSGRDCPCGGRMWLALHPQRYLICRDCNSIQVVEQVVHDGESQVARYFTHRDRYQMTHDEATRVRTDEPILADVGERSPARVIAEWVAAAHPPIEGDTYNDRLRSVAEQLTHVAANPGAYPPRPPAVRVPGWRSAQTLVPTAMHAVEPDDDDGPQITPREPKP